MYIISVQENNDQPTKRMCIMEILIRSNAFVSTCGINASSVEFKNWIVENGGKWVKVETDYLFTNQYNTEKFRVMDSMISAVRDDARIGKGKCIYCGTLVNEGESCTKKEDCSKYGIEWFTAKNTCFIAHPNGLPAVTKCKIEDEKKFGSFRLEHLDGALNYYRLKNNREKFEFLYCNGYFYMLGGGRKSHLGIKALSFNERDLKTYLQAQNDL